MPLYFCSARHSVWRSVLQMDPLLSGVRRRKAIAYPAHLSHRCYNPQVPFTYFHVICVLCGLEHFHMLLLSYLTWTFQYIKAKKESELKSSFLTLLHFKKKKVVSLKVMKYKME